MSRNLFSAEWHQVAELRPRMLPSVRIHRHVYRGKTWYIAQDQAGGRYHRLTPAAYRWVQRMDGQTTVQELWAGSTQTDTDHANTTGNNSPHDKAANHRPTEPLAAQDDIVNLLAQLHAADLLQANLAPDSSALFERFRKRRRQTWQQSLLNPISLKIPVFDPNYVLDRMVKLAQPLFSTVGMLLWLLCVLPAAILAGQHWDELTMNLADRVMASQNLVLMAALFPLVKLCHEFAHGIAVKAWRGQVHEMGLMFLIFLPTPYVDASAASSFPSKYRRAIVGAAGMMAELVLAALAMYVWTLSEAGLVRAICFNVMVISGISTLLVNCNPLLRYDGYFILCDLIEMPNLGQRGKQFLTYLSDRYLFKATHLEPPQDSRSEKAWMASYAILSWCYRVWISITIMLLVAKSFFFFGVLLALWSACTLVLLPIWNAWRHLQYGPSLVHRRTRSLRLSAGFLAIILIIFALVPVPMRTQTEGVVWLPEQAMLRAEVAGSVERWLVKPGSFVTAGTAVLMLEDPQLSAELALAEARVAERNARYRAEQFQNPVQAELSLQQLKQDQLALLHAQERYSKRIVRSATAGMVSAVSDQDMEQRYVKRGELLGYVLPSSQGKESNQNEPARPSSSLIDVTQLVVRAVVSQDDIDLVRNRVRGVELRLADRLEKRQVSRVLHTMPGAVNELPTAALSLNAGGLFATDPQDQRGLKTLEGVFLFDLAMPADQTSRVVGQRVHIRFEHQPEPLCQQAWRRLRQLFLRQLSV